MGLLWSWGTFPLNPASSGYLGVLLAAIIASTMAKLQGDGIKDFVYNFVSVAKMPASKGCIWV